MFNKLGILFTALLFTENIEIKHYKVQYKFGQYKLGSISSDFVTLWKKIKHIL